MFSELPTKLRKGKSIMRQTKMSFANEINRK